MNNTTNQRRAEAARKRGREIVSAIEGSFGSVTGGKDGQNRHGAVVASAPPRYTRDNQRARVYAAEKMIRRVLDAQGEHPLVQVCGSTIAVPLERVFGDLGQVQTYCTDALNRCWPAYSQAVRSGVTVRPRKGTTHAYYEQGGIIMVPVTASHWALHQYVVCHEIAHHLVGSEHGHNALWVRALFDLLSREMGPEAEFIARCLFSEAEVKM